MPEIKAPTPSRRTAALGSFTFEDALGLRSAYSDSPPHARVELGDPVASLAALTAHGAWYTGTQGTAAGLTASLGGLHDRTARLSTLSLERVLDSQTFATRAPLAAPQAQGAALDDAVLPVQRPPVAPGLRLVGVHHAQTQYDQPILVAQATPQPTAVPATSTPAPTATPTYARASYSQPAPGSGDPATWTAATMPGGNAVPFYITGYVATGNRTATGTIPHWGTVAVDPRVIPLHSTVYIQGLGIFTAEDTGGAVYGRHVDVFVQTVEQANALTGYRLVSFIPPAR